jgi:hypothetical protein
MAKLNKCLLVFVTSATLSYGQVGLSGPELTTTPSATPLPEDGYFKIDGRTYKLSAKSEDPSTGTSISEYTADNETVRNWKTLVTIHDFPTIGSPEEYIKKFCERYQQQNPGMKFAQGSNGSRTEFWMDAIFMDKPGSSPPPGTEKTVEWSFFKAAKHGSGTRVLQYSERKSYEKSPDEIFDEWDLKSRREKMLPILTESRMP